VSGSKPSSRRRLNGRRDSNVFAAFFGVWSPWAESPSLLYLGALVPAPWKPLKLRVTKPWTCVEAFVMIRPWHAK
jgi:hypothetical protein